MASEDEDALAIGLSPTALDRFLRDEGDLIGGSADILTNDDGHDKWTHPSWELLSDQASAGLGIDEAVAKRPRVELEDVSEGAASSGDVMQTKTKTAVGLEHMALKATDTQQFRFPWEKGVLAKIFSGERGPKLSGPKLSPGCSGAASLVVQVDDQATMVPKIRFKEPPEVVGLFQHVVKKAADVSAQTVRAKKRAQAIESWWELISTRMSASIVGRQIEVDATADNVHEIALEILDACFALKSPGTLYKRYYGLKSYYDWHCKRWGLDWLPMTEGKAWAYVKFLKESAAPPTKACTFIEACRFSWYILGLDGTGEVESSLRVRGVSAQMKIKKRPWSPADVLTILEVKKLHSILVDDTFHKIDRLFCGHALHLLYSRSRWSDLVSAQYAYIDEDDAFLELKTQQHKGAVSAEMKSRLLPIISPCVGIVEGNWAASYVKVREECNLHFPGEDPMPMLPAPADPEGNEWHSRPLSSEEGSAFLRMVLRVPKSSGRRISTHSLKSTSLSWTAKFGLSVESRALLARHASSLKHPVALYSRDLLSAVMREFTGVLAAMRSQGFNPDRTRSGMVTPAKMPGVPATPQGLGANLSTGTQVAAALGAQVMSAAVEPKLEELNVNLATSKDVFGDFSPDFDADDIDGADAGVTDASAPILVEDLSETEEEASQISTSDSGNEIFSRDVTEADLPGFGSMFFVNSKTLMIHCCRDNMTFRCGRKLTGAYEAVHELSGMRCTQCFDN